MIKVGTSGMTARYYGLSGATKVYYGSTLVWPSSYENQYLTFEILSGGTIGFDNVLPTVQYQLNSGAWTSYSAPLTVSQGDIIKWKGAEETYGDLAHFEGSAYFNPYGNIMSMIFLDNFIGVKELTNTNEGAFVDLLSGTNVYSAENLILPATGLCAVAYSGLFKGSTIEIPPQLPATIMAVECYGEMFNGCTNLQTIPDLSHITSGSPYFASNMFKGCTSLTSATTLPTIDVVNEAYQGLFKNCTNLSYVECLMENPPQNGFFDWMTGVANGGTFVKNANATWISGTNGIPTGWTVQTAH